MSSPAKPFCKTFGEIDKSLALLKMKEAYADSNSKEATEGSTEEKTFDSVIEAHRKRIGATKFGVTLGPDATPELLEQELNKQFDYDQEYYSFSREERLEARVAHYKSILDLVADLSKTNVRDFIAKLESDEQNDVQSLKSKLFSLVDLRSTINVHKDVEFMKGLRNGKFRSELPGRN